MDSKQVDKIKEESTALSEIRAELNELNHYKDCGSIDVIMNWLEQAFDEWIEKEKS